MSLKKLALFTAANMAMAVNGLDVPLYNPTRIDTKTYGVNPKRCKSCISFTWCKKSRGIRPMDVSCGSYKHKKKK